MKIFKDKILDELTKEVEYTKIEYEKAQKSVKELRKDYTDWTELHSANRGIHKSEEYFLEELLRYLQMSKSEDTSLQITKEYVKAEEALKSYKREKAFKKFTTISTVILFFIAIIEFISNINDIVKVFNIF